ncbi:RDD family protein [Streptomyces lydicus]|nr:RDD family protein [Streptomyces lydicus]
MSAPTSGSAGGSPTPGFYPDPSIPGYIRYWNGAAWVPGTSRPAPAEGEAMPAPPPGAAPPAAVEETGPVFLDEEEPAAGTALPRCAAAPRSRPGRPRRLGRPGPAARQQPGTGRLLAGRRRPAERLRRVRPPHLLGLARPGAPGTPSGAASWGAVPAPREQQAGDVPAAGDLPATSSQATPPRATPTPPATGPSPSAPSTRPPAAPRTPATRAPRRSARYGPTRTGPPPASPPRATRRWPSASPAPAVRRPAPRQRRAPQQLPSGGDRPQQGRPAPHGQAPAQPTPHRSRPGHRTGHPPAVGPAGVRAPAGLPPQGGAAPAAPAPQGAAPRASSPEAAGRRRPFFAAAQAAQGHPAALGRRLAARLIDTLVVGAVTAAVALPMWGTVTDHIDAKVEAAKQSGRQVTVYLVDGTTAPVFATLLAVLLIGGALYEALPTVKWGRTLGKKLCGVRVLDIESHDSPTLGAALKRWFVYSVLGVLAVGVVNVVWCLFDQPWRQCWHDKVARTFVASG